MKLWDKGIDISGDIEAFTVGQDRQLDLRLAKQDVWGSLAHITMLESIGLLKEQERATLHEALLDILNTISQGQFKIDDQTEDVHSQIEFMLTEKLGEVGKKIHSGRSRNDQVLVDIKLFLRDQIKELTYAIQDLCSALLELSEAHREVIIPGYTHMQAAMPSSFGLWFGAFAETLADDLLMLRASYQMVNQNPLGSAAGYGNSFPLDRQLTTKLLGFEDLHTNVVAAQMSRGKSEASVSFSLASVAATLGRMAMDICLYNSQNYGFLSFPGHITTGSSIMPHKKNPDVFELIRGRCNLIQQLPAQLMAITLNLPSGYHRDLQLTKELIIPGIDQLRDILKITTSTLTQVEVNGKIMDDPKYDLIYSVENVNLQVLQGIPFRDAYQQVAAEIDKGIFKPKKDLQHTHLGSIGNLGTEVIRKKITKVVDGFDFEIADKAIKDLEAR
ncbi:MAG: argininosuccinate lyase [Cyclobacteriaceae bacterium]|nr:argininosuccinate lyase [Cyclobacteriaceae bacterium]